MFFVVAVAVAASIQVYLWWRLVRSTTGPGRWRRVGTVAFVVGFLSLLGSMVFGTQAGSGVGLADRPRLPLAGRDVLPAPGAAGAGGAAAGRTATGWPAPAPGHGLPEPAKVPVAVGGPPAAGGDPEPDPDHDPDRRLLLRRAAAITAGLVAVGVTGFGVSRAYSPPGSSGCSRAAGAAGPAGGRPAGGGAGRHARRPAARRPARWSGWWSCSTTWAPTSSLWSATWSPANRSGSATALAPLTGMRGRYGTYYVTGNHEYYMGHEDWAEVADELGLRVLRNERVEIAHRGGAIDLAGVNDVAASSYGDPPDYAAALGDRDPSRPVVLMAHQPVAVHRRRPRTGWTCRSPGTPTVARCTRSTTWSGWSSRWCRDWPRWTAPSCTSPTGSASGGRRCGSAPTRSCHPPRTTRRLVVRPVSRRRPCWGFSVSRAPLLGARGTRRRAWPTPPASAPGPAWRAAPRGGRGKIRRASCTHDSARAWQTCTSTPATRGPAVAISTCRTSPGGPGAKEWRCSAPATSPTRPGVTTSASTCAPPNRASTGCARSWRRRWTSSCRRGSRPAEPTRFLLSVEISTIYKRDGRTRKVHHLVYLPDLDAADRFAAALGRIGNLASDGRPILGLDSRDLLEITLSSDAGRVPRPGTHLDPVVLRPGLEVRLRRDRRLLRGPGRPHLRRGDRSLLRPGDEPPGVESGPLSADLQFGCPLPARAGAGGAPPSPVTWTTSPSGTRCVPATACTARSSSSRKRASTTLTGTARAGSTGSRRRPGRPAASAPSVAGRSPSACSPGWKSSPTGRPARRRPPHARHVTYLVQLPQVLSEIDAGGPESKTRHRPRQRAHRRARPRAGHPDSTRRWRRYAPAGGRAARRGGRPAAAPARCTGPPATTASTG